MVLKLTLYQDRAGRCNLLSLGEERTLKALLGTEWIAPRPRVLPGTLHFPFKSHAERDFLFNWHGPSIGEDDGLELHNGDEGTV